MPSTIARLEAEVRADTTGARRDLQGLEDSLDSGGDAMDGMGGKGKALAAGLGALTLAAGLVAGAVGEAMNLEAVNDHLAASLGATPAQADKYGKAAASLYKGAWGESVAEVSAAIGSVVTSIKGMKDASQPEVEAMTAVALDYAKVMEMDVGRAAQVAGQLINSGLAKDGVAAFDLLTAASQKVPAAIREDVVDAADEYGQFFAGLGFSGEQAFGVLTSSAAKGAFGLDKTGDALKEFTIRATDMSSASKAGYDAIGLSQRGMSDAILKGGPTAQAAFQKIIGGLQGIKSPSDQAAAALALFGTPLEDLNVKDIPAFLKGMDATDKSLGNVDGAAQKMSDTLNDNASANITAFKRTVMLTATQAIGGALIPAISSLAKMANTYLGPALRALLAALVPVKDAFMAVAGFIADHQDVFRTAAIIITSLFIPAMIRAGVQATLQGARIVAMWVAQGIAATAGALASSAATVAVVAGWVLMGAQAMIQAARMAAAWLIAIGPVALIIAAVVGLALLIWKNWDKIKAATVAVFTAVWSFIKGAFDKVRGAVSAVIGWVRNNWPLLLAILTGPIGLAVLAIVKNWDKIKAGFRKVYESIVSVGGQIVTWFKGLPGMILGAVGDLGGLLKDAGVKVIQGFIGGIGSMVGAVKDKLGSITKSLTSWKGPPRKDATILTNAGHLVMQGFIDGLDAQRGAVKASLGAYTDMVAATAMPLLNASVSATGGMSLGTGDTAMARLGRGETNAAVAFTFQTYNPVAEAESVTTNKALDRVAALSLV